MQAVTVRPIGRVARQLPALVVLVAALGVFMFPFFWMISCSLKSLREVSIFPPPVLPSEPQFINYVIAFERAPLFRYGLNSLVVCTSVIVLVSILASMAAYAMVFLQFRLKELAFLLFLAPQMVSGVVLLLPLFVILHWFKLLNTMGSLIIPYSVLYAPFSVMLLRRYAETLPKEMVEAARVDGASEFWILTRVVMPLLRPALGTVALFCFIWSWNEFLFAMVNIQTANGRTISVGLAFLQALPEFPPQTNIILAAATAVTVPVLLVFVLMQRQFIQGMTAGAIK